MGNMDITFKQYSDDDYDFIYNVKKLLYTKYVDEYYGGWDDEAQYRMYDKYLETSRNDIRIILLGDEKIGFTDARTLPNGDYEQGNICILPEWQGKGIGTKILSDTILEHSKQDIVLRVFKSNPARNLYERLGFKVCDETKSHYLMKRSKGN